jgi:hypothetical protein
MAMNQAVIAIQEARRIEQQEASVEIEPTRTKGGIIAVTSDFGS